MFTEGVRTGEPQGVLNILLLSDIDIVVAELDGKESELVAQTEHFTVLFWKDLIGKIE